MSAKSTEKPTLHRRRRRHSAPALPVGAQDELEAVYGQATSTEIRGEVLRGVQELSEQVKLLTERMEASRKRIKSQMASGIYRLIKEGSIPEAGVFSNEGETEYVILSSPPSDIIGGGIIQVAKAGSQEVLADQPSLQDWIEIKLRALEILALHNLDSPTKHLAYIREALSAALRHVQ